MSADEAAKILECLAHGQDPFSLESLPASSPYHNPSVIRALFLASIYLNQSSSHRLPARAGFWWSDDETRKLIRAFENRVSISTIARLHQRTRFAVVLRLLKLGKFRPAGAVKEQGKAKGRWWIQQGRTEAGKRWSPAADGELLRGWGDGLPIDELAKLCRRGRKAVEVRLIKLGVSEFSVQQRESAD